MLASPVTSLPTGEGWLFEAKYDGFRAICEVNWDGAVSISSRKGTALGVFFPEIRDAVGEAFPPGTLVDAEIVRWAGDRLDFQALVRRIAAGPFRAAQLAAVERCHLVCFDVLRLAGRDVHGLPLTERRAILESLLATLPGAHLITISLLTSLREEAELWLEVLPRHGIEGLVIKAGDQPYLPGRRGGWLKLRRTDTQDCIVGAVTGSLAAPDRLVLGRYDGDRLRIVATTGPLDPRARDQIAALLTPTTESPWPDQITSGWGRPPTPIHHGVPVVRAEKLTDIPDLH